MANYPKATKETGVVSIVDDDASLREALSALTRSLGYSTRTFSSAEEYLGSASVDATRCLITDVRMPGLSGIELQEQLVNGGRKIPVIFISEQADAETKKRALHAGAICFLAKPFKDEQLVRCLKVALAG